MNPNVSQVTSMTRDVVQSLLEDPATARIDVAVIDADEPNISVTLRASPRECSRVIGSHGAIIKSIRTYCYALARKHGCYVKVYVEPNQDECRHA